MFDWPSRQINDFSQKENRKKIVSGQTWLRIYGALGLLMVWLSESIHLVIVQSVHFSSSANDLSITKKQSKEWVNGHAFGRCLQRCSIAAPPTLATWKFWPSTGAGSSRRGGWSPSCEVKSGHASPWRSRRSHPPTQQTSSLPSGKQF